MKIALSEKQYKILKNIVEQETTGNPSSQPSAGTSNTQSGGQGYPQVTKWESGVQRGPSNQIGITKWSDVVGSKLTRGKSNPLNEQQSKDEGKDFVQFLSDLPHNLTYDTPVDTYKTPWNTSISIPKNCEDILLYSNNESIAPRFADKDENGNPKMTEDGQYIMSGYLAPQESYFHLILPEGTLRQFKTIPDGKMYGILLDPSKLPNWRPMQGYFARESNGGYTSYNPDTYIQTSYITEVGHWLDDHWADLLVLLAASLTGYFAGLAALGVLGTELAGATAFSFYGWAPTNQAVFALLGEAHIWVGRGIYQIFNGKKESGVMDLIFGLVLPAAHGLGIAQWGVDVKVVESTAIKVAGKTSEEVSEIATKSLEEGGFTNAEKEYYGKVSEASEETIEEITKKVIDKAVDNLKKEGKLSANSTLKEILVKANKVVRTSNIGAFLRRKWYTWVPTTLAHDLPFLSLIGEIEKKFGVVDEVTINEISKMYSMDPQKAIEATQEGLKKSSKLTDLKSTVQNEWGKIDLKTNNVKLDSLGKVDCDDNALENLFNQTVQSKKKVKN